MKTKISGGPLAALPLPAGNPPLAPCPSWCVEGEHLGPVEVEVHWGDIHALGDEPDSVLVGMTAEVSGGDPIVVITPERDRPYDKRLSLAEARELAHALLRVVAATDDRDAATLAWLLTSDTEENGE